MTKVSAIILAAGTGKRFGGYKQFIKIKNEPLCLFPIRTFLRIKEIEEIILVVPARFLKKFRQIFKSIKKKIKVIAGGNERYHSAKKATAALSSTTNMVLFHDAARPLVSEKTIKKAISEAEKFGASVVAIPASDTIKFSEDGKFVKKTLPREKIFIAQTPQVFQRKILEKMYKKIDAKATDDSYLAEKSGARVRIVLGEKKNFKITTKDDLKLLDFYLKKYENRNWL